MKYKTIMILGQPGTGKSTLNSRLSRYFESNDTFAVRAYVTYLKNNKHPIYEKIRPYAEKKEIIPTYLVEEVFENFLEGFDEDQLLILEGFPLNHSQRDMCNSVLKKMKRKLDLIIYLRADKKVIFKRVLSRRICNKCEHDERRGVSYNDSTKLCPVCGSELTRRNDDTQAYLEKRYDIHVKNISEILNTFNDTEIAEIDTSLLTEEEVFNQVVELLD